MWWKLKWHLLSKLLSTLFTCYFCLHGAIDWWTWTALMLFDAGSCFNKTVGFSHWLCRMTRWNRPPLTRQLAAYLRQHTRHRHRSPRIYVRPTRHSKGTAIRPRYQSARPFHLLLVTCATSTQQVCGPMLFDTDSFVIGIDNCASKCLTDNRRDFVGPLQ
jgi:hypothetical protein